MTTRTLEPWEAVKADDRYRDEPVGPEMAGVQAASFPLPVTRRLTVTLDLADAKALATTYPWALPHADKTLERLIVEVEAES